MRPLEANEAMRGVGRLSVRCAYGDGILKEVQILDYPAATSACVVQEMMVTVARHYGPDVVVPIDAVQVLEYGDAPIPKGER